VASVERTAYPRFRRLVTARELALLSPTGDEVAWAKARARSPEHQLALVLLLRCFQRLGYFPRDDEVPLVVTEHVRRALGLPEGTAPSRGIETAKWQRRLVRERLGVVHDPERARAVAVEAIRSAAEVKNHPPDLINVALEMLVRNRTTGLARALALASAGIAEVVGGSVVSSAEERERQHEGSPIALPLCVRGWTSEN